MFYPQGWEGGKLLQRWTVVLSPFLCWRGLSVLLGWSLQREGSAWPALYRSWSVGPVEREGAVASLWAVQELVALM